MAKVTIKGGEQWMDKMNRAGKNADKMIHYAVHPAAGYVTDEVRSKLSSMPTDDSHKVPRNGLRSNEMKDVIASLGISKFRNENGYIHVRIGFNDYGSHPTKKYPKGVPNAMLARSLEGGSPYLNARPFMRTTINKCKKNAIAIMDEQIDKYTEEMFSK